MMRTKLFVAGAVFCILGMAGCSNEMVEQDGTTPGEQVQIIMRTSVEEAQTRAIYTDDEPNGKMRFSWTSGDQISVYLAGGMPMSNLMQTTGSGKSVDFTGSIVGAMNGQTIYAVYPYSQVPHAIMGMGNAATVTLTLPNPQNYMVGGQINNSFMVGSGQLSSGTMPMMLNANASMKQVMSIIKLNITGAPGKVTGVKLKCAEALFPTMATAKLSDATITNPSNLVNELSMTVTDNTTGTDKAVSFAMFPTNLTGKKVQVEVSFEGGTSKTIEKDGINFERNVHYVMAFDDTPVVDFIEIGNLKIAKGNLVADGVNGCKIGVATDGGLYFQFGSLIGWSATGNPTIAISPIGYNGSTTWNEDWKGDPATEDAAAGTGDPCKYYLKGTWRLPTKDDYAKLFENHGYPSGSWKKEGAFAADSESYAVHTSGLKYPASGCRSRSDGSLSEVGTVGYYWSASPNGGSVGCSLSFGSTDVSPLNFFNRANGYLVRCVQDPASN